MTGQTDITAAAGISSVTLQLGGELMAIPADCLREILEPVAVTRVPLAGAFVAGLINVRGVVVPLADLRVAFGMPLTDATPDTRMLVLDVSVANEVIVVAILADKVHDVTGLDPSTLEPIPPVGTRWSPDFVRGIVKGWDGFVILPDLERIFTQGSARCALATQEGK